MNLLPKIFPQSDDQQQAKLERQLIREEAKLGGQIFGPVAKNHRREFFCLDEHTWVWFEEWIENGQRQAVTTRYNVRPTGILKSQDGQGYQPVDREEARHLVQAADLYWKRINQHYSQLLHAA